VCEAYHVWLEKIDSAHSPIVGSRRCFDERLTQLQRVVGLLGIPAGP
jgi:hypothetical protein